ncbi:MAG: hypothetical protein HY774_03260 [Acidobacteria bacterium]|nr:hypothetical protein [Acidobacteriota bacterium]
MKPLTLLLVLSTILLIGIPTNQTQAGAEFPLVFQMQVVIFQDGSKQFSLNPDPLEGDIRGKDDYLRWEDTAFHGKQATVITFHIVAWRKDQVMELKERRGIELNAFPLFEGSTPKRDRQREYPCAYKIQVITFKQRNPRIVINPNPIERADLNDKALVKCEENQFDSPTGERCTVCTLYFLEWDPVTVRQVAKLSEK